MELCKGLRACKLLSKLTTWVVVVGMGHVVDLWYISWVMQLR